MKKINRNINITLIGYENGWNFTRPKKRQIPNSSCPDVGTVVLSGSNMSGKTHFLVHDLFINLCGQTFGLIPAHSGNIRIYDDMAFIDRASTDSTHDLSAFGSECGKWKCPLESAGEHTLFIVDEGFSTTSPFDQAELLKAAKYYLRQKGARFELATHNERFIQGQEKSCLFGAR